MALHQQTEKAMLNCVVFLFIFSPLTALIGSGATELFLAQLWVWGSLQSPQGDGSCNDF